MTTAKKILGTAFGEEESKLYVDDVFSTYLYTGNGSTQAITNGIDLKGKGGMLWLKSRSAGNGHTLRDSVRGPNFALNSNATGAQFDQSSINPTFNNNGFSLQLGENASGGSYVGWTFRRAPKFFDVVTYTGDGDTTQRITHSLGISPGMIIIKRTDGTSDWGVWHVYTNMANSLCNLALNSTAGASVYGSGGHTTTTFNPYSVCDTANAPMNANGAKYVAYLFAHDPSADGIIQCGRFTTDASGNATVNLGWEPQFGIIKASSATQDWYMMDSMRGMPVEGSSLGQLFPNTSGAEVIGTRGMHPTATGFVATGFLVSQTYIYLAIRRSNKPPKTGTEVYNAIARAGTGAQVKITGVGFSPDVVLHKTRNTIAETNHLFSKLIGLPNWLRPTTANAEYTSNVLNTFDMDGVTTFNSNSGLNYPGATYVQQYFRCAPGFFDMVCYTGTGTTQVLGHNLGVIPELAIVKSRSISTADWAVYSSGLDAAHHFIYLNKVSASVKHITDLYLERTSSTQFKVNFSANITNNPGHTYVAYLFATLPGISKVGSYTGNGGTQTIDCGFTTGARFILIKRTDSTGDWYVWDTARGIVAANDPHLSLNTTAAEVTSDDSVDPAPEGFICNQVAATNINVSGGQYIFLAIA